jgi:hypothetical protein
MVSSIPIVVALFPLLLPLLLVLLLLLHRMVIIPGGVPGWQYVSAQGMFEQ